MTRYQIVTTSDTDGMEELVAELIADGWMPIGGVSVIYREWENERKGYTEDEHTFYQAMIKEEKP